jgi:hypothetical protein
VGQSLKSHSDDSLVVVPQVNSAPALTASSASDFELKYQLISDTLDVVDAEVRTPSVFPFISLQGTIFTLDCHCNSGANSQY